MGLGKYILDRNNNPVLCDDVLRWGEWFESASKTGRKVVAKTNLGFCEVSTVFLGLDHGFDDGPPILFETMIFGLTMDQSQWRCSTWDEAVEQHRRVVEHLQAVNASN